MWGWGSNNVHPSANILWEEEEVEGGKQKEIIYSYAPFGLGLDSRIGGPDIMQK